MWYLIVSILCVAAVIQGNASRWYIASCFCIGVLMHNAFFYHVENSMYYLSAAMIDLIVMVIISRFKCRAFVYKMLFVCVVSIMLNGLGWALWHFYLPPTFYDQLFLLFYCSVIAIFINEGLNVGFNKNPFGILGVFDYNIKRHNDYRKI